MKAICYKNTKTTIPNFEEDTHIKQTCGYAYESNEHYIHIYGRDSGIYTISPGLTVCEKKNGTLEEWVKKTFGAIDIVNMKKDVGTVEKSIWRPGLLYNDEIEEGLVCDSYERRNSELKLKILLEKLSDILLYIEPTSTNINVYGHKIRELLIISCTEVENHFLAILRNSSLLNNNKVYKTNDYVKLKTVAHLDEYVIKYRGYKHITEFKPFISWNVTNPTQSLDWYDAYNKTKHNSDNEFKSAKLKYVLDAVAANIILHCVRFGPYELYNGSTILSAYINQFVEIYLENPDITSFYVPKIILPKDSREDLFIYDSYFNKHNQKWISNNIVI